MRGIAVVFPRNIPPIMGFSQVCFLLRTRTVGSSRKRCSDLLFIVVSVRLRLLDLSVRNEMIILPPSVIMHTANTTYVRTCKRIYPSASTDSILFSQMDHAICLLSIYTYGIHEGGMLAVAATAVCRPAYLLTYTA